MNILDWKVQKELLRELRTIILPLHSALVFPSFKVDNNEFGREGAKHIANALIENKELKALYISILYK